MLESKFQKEVIDDIRKMYPECEILKTDPNYLQGVPDLVIFYKDKYAFLEVKNAKPRKSDYQPNQEYYIQKFDEWMFAHMICPENKDEVYFALQQTFGARR